MVIIGQHAGQYRSGWYAYCPAVDMRYTKVLKAAAILLILVLLTVILVYGKPFFVSVCFAGLLSMLLLPIAKWLQSKRIHPAVSILLSMLTLVAFIAMVAFLVNWQLSDIADNASKLEQQVSQKYQQARQFVARQLGITPQQQQQMIKEQQQSSGGRAGAMVTGLLSGVGAFLANFLLVFVYIFLFMYFRGRIKGFIVRLVPPAQRDNALSTIYQAQEVAQKYLSGMSLMIVSLWIMYGIGFSIAGVKNAFFFAVMCGLLEIIPFIGNLTGTALTLLMSLVQGGDMSLVIGILVTYAVVQFIQSYLLEPLIVGAEVNINPMATIVGLVVGELVWGIPGMILAIPLMGIARIICDHVPALQPYAYLIGEEKKEGNRWKKKIKEAVRKARALFAKS
jgi:predicted PurR-regulated permease PerM